MIVVQEQDALGEILGRFSFKMSFICSSTDE